MNLKRPKFQPPAPDNQPLWNAEYVPAQFIKGSRWYIPHLKQYGTIYAQYNGPQARILLITDRPYLTGKEGTFFNATTKRTITYTEKLQNYWASPDELKETE